LDYLRFWILVRNTLNSTDLRDQARKLYNTVLEGIQLQGHLAYVFLFFTDDRFSAHPYEEPSYGVYKLEDF
jgi:hypothetical protein